MKYWREHEKNIKQALAGKKTKTDWVKLYNQHQEKIKLIQHERLIHLLVTLAFGIFSLITFFSFLLVGRAEIAIPTFVFFATTAAYVAHYYNLENTTQRWYGLADQLAKKLK